MAENVIMEDLVYYDGCSRLEVCSSLAEGGLTPSTGLVRCLIIAPSIATTINIIIIVVVIVVTRVTENVLSLRTFDKGEHQNVFTRVITENVAIPAFAMLRPRGGDFVYTKLEQEVSCQLLLLLLLCHNDVSCLMMKQLFCYC